MKPAGAGRDPDLLHGSLGVHHNVGAVFEHQRQQIAAAAGFDIDVLPRRPIVGLAFDAVQNLVDQRKKFGFSHNRTCKNYGVSSVPLGTRPHGLTHCSHACRDQPGRGVRLQGPAVPAARIRPNRAHHAPAAPNPRSRNASMTPHSSSRPILAGDPHFHYQNGVLHAEGVALDTLAAQLGTPLYVYSRAALRQAWQSYSDAIGSRPVLVCYGMKANSNLAVLKEFARLGAGFDIVSGGELKRVLAAGGDPSKVVFSGVGKQPWEIRDALLAGVKCFNAESQAELHCLSDVALSMDRRARVSLRVNPDVDAHTHPYISTGLKENKFGIAIESALDAYRLAASLPGVEVVGVDCHIGSQLTDISPYFDALEKLLDLIEQLDAAGISIQHLDLGGGLGIRYTDEIPPSPKALLDRVFDRLQARGMAHLHLILEPGRSLVGNAGVLLTTVQYLKHAEARNFAIVDAAMNDLLRPALYDAYHGLQPV